MKSTIKPERKPVWVESGKNPLEGKALNNQTHYLLRENLAQSQAKNGSWHFAPLRIIGQIMLLFLLSALLQSAVVHGASRKYGEYSESNIEDLSVKVQGGYIKITRSWSENQWFFNQHWNGLEEVTRQNILYGLSRNGYVYKKVDSDTYVDESDPVNRIVKTVDGYRWSDRIGNYIDYDNLHKFVGYGDQNDNYVSLTYDANGRLSGVWGPDGVQGFWFDYTLDGSNNVVSFEVRDELVEGVNTRKVTYTYNIYGQLVSVIDARGKTWGYTYSDTTVNARIATKLDPENRATTIKYLGVVVSSIVDATGRETLKKHEYDKAKRQYYSQEKTPGGKITETWLNADGKVIRVDVNGATKRTIAFDTAANTSTETNVAGYKTIRKYDQWDNVTKVTRPDGSTRTTTYRASDNLITSQVNERGIQTNYEYHANGNLAKVTGAVGTPAQRVTDYAYYADGNLYTLIRKGDAKTAMVTTTFTYGAKGNLDTVTDPEGHLMFSAPVYNKAGQLLEWKDGRTLVWKRTYDKAGNLLTVTNPVTPTNETQTFEYDSTGNLIRRIAPDNTVSEMKYDPEGRPTEMISPLLASTKISYNAAGQIQQIVDAENRVVQSLKYDLYERPIETSDGVDNTIAYEYGGDQVLPTQLATIINPLHRSEYRYDVLGRPVQVTKKRGADARVSKSGYDALDNLIESTDPNGKVTRHSYDEFNRLIESQDVTTGHTVKYSYDNRDNLLTVTNENNIVIRTYAYNKNNQKITETWAGGEVFTYAYDANGNLISKLEANTTAQLTRYDYDNANRLKSVRFFIGVLADIPYKTVDYSYDSKGRFTGYNNSVTSSVITYDDADHKLSETVNFGPFSKTIAMTYYKNGLRKTFTGADPDPDGVGELTGTTVSYQYDAANRWQMTDLPGEGTVMVNTYNWMLPTKITLPGGANQNQQYDPFGQVIGIQSKDPAQNPLMDLSYTHDKVGNILSKTNKEGTTHYTYDDRYRLTGVAAPNPADNESYSYDPAGNRLTAHNTTGNWQYNNNNQLLAYGERSFTYDKNGNTTTESDTSTSTPTLLNTYVYNQEDRLTEVLDGSATVIANYDYDPLGRRIKKTTGVATTYYLYSDDGLVAEFDELGNELQSYGYVPNSLWGTSPLYTKTAGAYAYYHTDHLGTPQMLTANNGAKVWEGKMDAFGQMTITTETITNNLRFPGQYYDQETAQQYNYFRIYDSRIGRYTTSDPIGLRGGSNTYSYVDANPLSWLDPIGLREFRINMYYNLDNPIDPLMTAEFERIFNECFSSCEADSVRVNWIPVKKDVDNANLGLTGPESAPTGLDVYYEDKDLPDGPYPYLDWFGYDDFDTSAWTSGNKVFTDPESIEGKFPKGKYSAEDVATVTGQLLAHEVGRHVMLRDPHSPSANPPDTNNIEDGLFEYEKGLNFGSAACARIKKALKLN